MSQNLRDVRKFREYCGGRRGVGSVLGEETAIAETLSGNIPVCLKNSNTAGVAGVE